MCWALMVIVSDNFADEFAARIFLYSIHASEAKIDLDWLTSQYNVATIYLWKHYDSSGILRKPGSILRNMKEFPSRKRKVFFMMNGQLSFMTKNILNQRKGS